MKIDSIRACARLNNGVDMPWLGLGVFKLDDGAGVKQAVGSALEMGYRSIDTASAYGNERGTGEAVAESGIPREQIFITTKLWNSDQRAGRTPDAFEESLERLATDYVDLYLVHWPVADCYRQTWQAMQEIYESGRARAIGVSNFLVHHLEDILRDGQVVPAVNQVEFHPRLLQPELLAYCRDREIQIEAWSPLMRGRVAEIETLRLMAEKYQRTAAQLVLRWNLQHEVVTIPKSASSARIAENMQIFDFEISADDMATLDALDEGSRTGPDPDNFNF